MSHDRYFADAVVTRITDINLRTLTDYVGNYSKYVEQRDAMLIVSDRPSASRTRKSPASRCSSTASGT